MDISPTLIVADLMARQLGHVTRPQLLRAGLARSTIQRMEARGELVRVGARTWRARSSPRTPDGDILAACLDLDGVASHWTAAALHGLVGLRPVLDVTVPKRRSVWVPSAGTPALRVHTSTDLPDDDVVSVRGVPTFGVARTLMTLGALVPRELSQPRLVELLSTACQEGLASERWLLWMLEQRRCRGRDGVIAFEEALAERLRLGPTESWLEREVLRIIEEAGLPRPRVQRRVERRGRFAARVDFGYDGTPLVMEALGYRHHRTREQVEADTRRVNQLVLAGRTVLQWTYDQVVRDPASVVAELTSALGRHGHVAA